jgi:uncharacterized protein YyaL (SSP411 family)
MLSAFARGAAILEHPAYLEAAQKTARFLHSNLWNGQTLLRSFRNGPAPIHGFAEDYAFLIQGLLDLYEADFDPAWIGFALQLQETLDARFLDAESGGYFGSEAGDTSILVRSKEDHDGAEPAASSVAARNLLRLAEFTGDERLRQSAEKTLRAFSLTLQKAPNALPQMLGALDQFLAPSQQIVIAGEPNAPDTRALLRVIHRKFLPNRVLLLSSDKTPPLPQPLQKRFSEVALMRPLEGRAAAYVCENFTCKAPVTDAEALARLLGQKPVEAP